MILYDKSGLFLGMGNQELYFLGYEDMEEFKNYHNDFADLFINKPGYIFKFKNFSWIDYTLHSGTPNKKVIVKTKNGKEIETALVIHEIFLDHAINGAMLCYCIEITNNALKADISQLAKVPTAVRVEESSPPAKSIQDISSDDFIVEDAPMVAPQFTVEEDTPNDISITFDTAPINFDTDNDEKEVLLPSALQEESSNNFKLKMDYDILTSHNEPKEETPPQAPLDYQSIDDITSADLTFVTPQENYPDDEHEDLLNDSNLRIEEIKYTTTPSSIKEIFDLSESAEKLGLDISTIAQIIGEFSDELTVKMKTIQDDLVAQRLHEANQEIVKLKSIALNLNILSLVDSFTLLQKALEAGTQEEIQAASQTLEHSISEFKEMVQ